MLADYTRGFAFPGRFRTFSIVREAFTHGMDSWDLDRRCDQLGTLAETQRTLNVQTGQLVTALRRPQTRGQWGEITLRRLVELAGMSNRCDFCEQTSVESEDGRFRPDMIVNLPGARTIVID